MEMGSVYLSACRDVVLVLWWWWVFGGGSVSKERLADSLWGERLPQKYVGTVESCVSVLRSRLEPGRAGRGSVVVTEPGAYRLATGLMRLDLDVFDELVVRAGVE